MIRSLVMVCGRCEECMEFRGKLLKAVQRFYIDSRACVWVGIYESGFRLMMD